MIGKIKSIFTVNEVKYPLARSGWNSILNQLVISIPIY